MPAKRTGPGFARFLRTIRERRKHETSQHVLGMPGLPGMDSKFGLLRSSTSTPTKRSTAMSSSVHRRTRRTWTRRTGRSALAGAPGTRSAESSGTSTAMNVSTPVCIAGEQASPARRAGIASAPAIAPSDSGEASEPSGASSGSCRERRKRWKTLSEIFGRTGEPL